MGRRRPALHAVLLLASALASEGLRLRESLIPPYKLRGETVELRCDYDPGNSSIYSVKWFKDDEEFYRYVPRDTPPDHVFPRAGVTLDENSQPGRLILKQVGFNTSGQYRCEVSAEGPDFITVTARGSLLVIEPPTSGPVITGGKTRYHVNDTVDLVCTSSPSQPPTRLSWKINGRPAPQNVVSRERPYMSKDGLVTQISRLVFEARPYHFQRGVLRVKCVAGIDAEILTHHTTIPETFKAWERSFQASVGNSRMSHTSVLLLALFLLFLLSACITTITTLR